MPIEPAKTWRTRDVVIVITLGAWAGKWVPACTGMTGMGCRCGLFSQCGDRSGSPDATSHDPAGTSHGGARRAAASGEASRVAWPVRFAAGCGGRRSTLAAADPAERARRQAAGADHDLELLVSQR